MKYFWAGLLIIIGVVFLAGNFNLVSQVQLANLLYFWPVALILWGLYLVVKGRKEANSIMLIALIISALLVSYLAFSQNSFTKDNTPQKEQQSAEVTEKDITAELPKEAKKAKVTVNSGAIKFNIDDATDKLLDGTLISNFMESELKTSLSGDEASATLTTNSIKRRLFFFRDFRNELNLKLNDKVPLSLEVNTGASELRFDLSNLKISGLLVKAGASNLNLILGNQVQNDAKIQVQAGASDINIEVPKEIGVKITTESALADTQFDGFEKKSDNTWESNGYGDASKKIEITLKAGASSLKVNRD